MKKTTSLLLFISSIGLVHAAETPHLFNNHEVGVLLSDDILSGQRGKFISGPQAHYFGIEFVTSVAGPNNTMITKGMQLNVNFNRGQPKVGVSVYGNEALADSAQNNIGESAPNGSGVVQGAQIAGNSNIGVNDFVFIPGKMTPQGTELKQGHYQLNLPDGMMHYEFNSGGLGMSYTSADGKISSTQMLRSNVDNKGFVQHFSISDNSRLLSNQAKFYMGDQLGVYDDLSKVLQQQLPTGIR